MTTFKEVTRSAINRISDSPERIIHGIETEISLITLNIEGFVSSLKTTYVEWIETLSDEERLVFLARTSKYKAILYSILYEKYSTGAE